MKSKIIELNDIHFSYQKDKQFIKDFNVTLYKNENIGIIGPNGAGKSTLLKLLIGLHFPTQGKIIIDGKQVKNGNIEDVKQKVGYAFQDADNQLFMPTVYEDVAFAPRNYGYNEQEVNQIVKNSLNMVGALHLSKQPPYKLSGGEKRVVTIATVLSMNPEVIILDEPSVGLDPKSRRNLINILKNLDKTKIIATHDMDMALEVCDRIIIINNGSIYGDAKPEDIFSNDQLLLECSLEKPLSMQGCPICNKNIIIDL